jgi:adenylate cyclase class 2
MAIEMEAKLKVEALEPTRARLLALHATPAGTRLETNALFDLEDGSLRNAGKGLRVRTRRDLETGRTDAILTFKGPRQQGKFKSREEIETDVTDPNAMIGIIEALGYRQVLSFEKKRESWEIDGCHVELDELPHVGCFVEIEGPAEQEISALQEKLGLGSAEPMKSSYVGMMVEWLKTSGAKDRIVTF